MNEELSSKDSRYWYCVRTQVKQEHIASGLIKKNLNLETFNPRISKIKSTSRGPVRFTESLFPCYVFVKMDLRRELEPVAYTMGVSTIVNFNRQYPHIEDSVICELRESLEIEGEDDTMFLDIDIKPGTNVEISGGCFHGFNAVVLRVMPAKSRVAVLMDFLGRKSETCLPVQSVVPTTEHLVKLRKQTFKDRTTLNAKV